MCLPFLQKLRPDSCTQPTHRYEQLSSSPPTPIINAGIPSRQFPQQQQPPQAGVSHLPASTFGPIDQQPPRQQSLMGVPAPARSPATTAGGGGGGGGVGVGPGGPATAYAPLSTQHERLMLELLPFKEVSKFHEWLRSPPLRGCWAEFCRDFLASSPHSPEPEKARTAQAAKDAVQGRRERFLVYHPDKTGWSAEDHHARFIVQVVSDGLLRGTWSESEWKKKGLDLAKAVYEVLSFLRATQPISDMHPPRYSA